MVQMLIASRCAPHNRAACRCGRGGSRSKASMAAKNSAISPEFFQFLTERKAKKKRKIVRATSLLFTRSRKPSRRSSQQVKIKRTPYLYPYPNVFYLAKIVVVRLLVSNPSFTCSQLLMIVLSLVDAMLPTESDTRASSTRSTENRSSKPIDIYVCATLVQKMNSTARSLLGLHES